MSDHFRSADQAHAALPPSLFQLLMQTSPDLLFILDGEHRIAGTNASLMSKWGMDAKALEFHPGSALACKGQTAQGPACSQDTPCLCCAATQALHAPVNPAPTAIPALVPGRAGSPSHRLLEITARPVEFDNFTGTAILAQDITDRHFWNKMERSFFHDVNNTLTPLYGGIQLLQLQHPLDQDIQACQRHVERLMGEVALQKRMTRHRNPSPIAQFEPATTDEIRQQVRMALQDHSAAYGKRFYNSWPDPAVKLNTDPLLAAKVIIQMCINAFTATEPTGHIRLSTRVTDPAVTWEVWHPAAIPPDHRDGIFQRGATPASESEGDLETYAIKRIGQEILKGRVGFASDGETGTRFSFTLPR